jgi:hypothetical protein
VSENALSPKTVAILRLIADGQSYTQIVDGHVDITYLDIFSAAGEALELGEMVSEERGPRTRAVPPPPARDLPPVPTRPKRAPIPVNSKVILARIKEKHPRAYQAWTADEDAQLVRLSRTGISLDGLARTFGRRPSAVRSRMTKLGLP